MKNPEEEWDAELVAETVLADRSVRLLVCAVVPHGFGQEQFM